MIEAMLDSKSAGKRALPAEGRGPAVSIQELNKAFRRSDGTQVRAIDSLSLDVGTGEFTVLLGPSGCGKTTLLRTIAGLERADSGKILIQNSVCLDSAAGVFVPPEDRHLSMMFQSYALWPHKSVFDNVAYPLQIAAKQRGRHNRRQRRDDIRRAVSDALNLVGIPELHGQYPGQMSGGQQQRVALARAIASNNGVVLFDEPLSNVDAKVRESLRQELVTMQRKLKFTAIFVTHDQDEAMSMADRIIVMEHGRIAQAGTPSEIYETPASRYVANFIGKSNEFRGSVVTSDAEYVTVDTPAGPIKGVSFDGLLTAGETVFVSWRPESTATAVPSLSSEFNVVPGHVDRRTYLGAYNDYYCRVNGGEICIRSGPSAGLTLGQAVDCVFDARSVHIFREK